MKKSITPVELDHLSSSIDDVVVMDVRTPEEYSAFHLPGSTNVPLALFKLDSFQPPVGVVVVTVCIAAAAGPNWLPICWTLQAGLPPSTSMAVSAGGSTSGISKRISCGCSLYNVGFRNFTACVPT
jgi:hypothetical protein